MLLAQNFVSFQQPNGYILITYYLEMAQYIVVMTVPFCVDMCH